MLNLWNIKYEASKIAIEKEVGHGGTLFLYLCDLYGKHYKNDMIERNAEIKILLTTWDSMQIIPLLSVNSLWNWKLKMKKKQQLHINLHVYWYRADGKEIMVVESFISLSSRIKLEVY